MTHRIASALTGLAVLAVAVVAGIVSFSHIETLALSNGYSVDTARLLPVSVDGLIVAASLALLTGARAHREAPRLARAGLVLGIVATLAANVEAGARFGAVGALVNAWPAVGFIVASEILLGMMRGPQDVPLADEATETVADSVPEDVPEIVPADVTEDAVHTAPDATAGTVSDAPEDVPAEVPEEAPEDVPAPVPAIVPRTVSRRRAPSAKPKSPERLFAAELQAGTVPSLRSIKSRAKCGTPRAQEIRAQLVQLMEVLPDAA